MSNFKQINKNICRICLDSNSKMFWITNTPLQDIYERLTISKMQQMNLPVTVCCICFTLLKNCYSLCQLAQNSEKILLNLYHSGIEITSESFNNLKRPLQKYTRTSMEIISLSINDHNDHIDHIDHNDRNDHENDHNDHIDHNVRNDHENDQNDENDHNGHENDHKDHENDHKDPEYDHNNHENDHNNHENYQNDHENYQNGHENDETISTPVQNELFETSVEKIEFEIDSADDTDFEMKDLEVTSDSDDSDMVLDSEDEIPLKLNIKKKTRKKIKENCKKEKEDSADDRDCEIKDLEVTSDSDDSVMAPDSEDEIPLKLNIKKKSRKKIKENCKKEKEDIKIDAKAVKLSKEQQIKDVLDRKKSSNYINSLYKCDFCYKGFANTVTFNNHMLLHDLSSGTYECDVCRLRYKTSFNLSRHVHRSHSRHYSCNKCGRVSYTFCQAKDHEKWHDGVTYQCKICCKDFKKKTTYLSHVRLRHPTEHVCNLCGHNFIGKAGLTCHKGKAHKRVMEIPPDGPYCEPCNVRFLNEEAYQTHISISPKHENKSIYWKIHQEKLANGTYKRYKRHPTRKVEGPIPCEQCGLQLEDSRAYHIHFRKVHPEKNRTKYPAMKTPFMCEQCGKLFQSQAHYEDHRWVHTGERPFKCDQCNKSFRTKQRLFAHKHVHSSVKTSYVCKVCGKNFSTHGNRQRHMLRHTGLRPFKCEMCDKTFHYAYEKRTHIEYVHLKKPWPKRSRGKRRDKKQGSPAQGMASQDMD